MKAACTSLRCSEKKSDIQDRMKCDLLICFIETYVQVQSPHGNVIFLIFQIVISITKNRVGVDENV